MALAEPTTDAAPACLERLVGRYDHRYLAPVKPGSRVRLEVEDRGAWDAVIRPRSAVLEAADEYQEPDAHLTADATSWRRIDTEIRAGMNAFGAGRLSARGNLHLGVGFLAAASASEYPGRLCFQSVDTPAGPIAYASAGTGPETIVCLHGLGGTKGSFLPTLSDLAGDEYRVIALDFPGFGDSTKPIGAAYDAPFFADSVRDTLDALGIERAHFMGNSMGGRVALELGMRHPERTGKLVMLCPAMAWLKGRRWAAPLRLVRPELGLIQPAPRPVVENLVRRLVPGAHEGWTASGVDEFLRIYCKPRGRAAFYAAARNIYLDEPNGETGLWTRLESLGTDSLFVWGRRDSLVPISFRKHVERCLPSAEHVELSCGHVPQVESPAETHRAVRKFLRA